MPHEQFKIKKENTDVLKNKPSKLKEGGGIFVSLLAFLAKFFNFLIYIFAGALLCIVLLFLLILPEIKEIYTVYKLVDNGKIALTEAIFNAKEENYRVAEHHFALAYDSFIAARNNLDDLYLKKFPVFKDYLFVADRFLRVAEQVSLGALNADSFWNEVYNDYSDYQNISFNQIPLEARRDILAKLVESPQVLRSLKQNLNLSLLYLDQIESKKLFTFWDDLLLESKDKIAEAHELLDFAISIARIFPQLAAYPNERDYLVLLQNNHELRPTGGFIGTYGILKVQNAEVLDFYTKDVYSLDNEAGYYGFNMEPPWQLKEYLKVGQYYFRDANWKPDFEEAAKDLIWFYKAEYARIHGAEPQIDGVIAIMPEMITNLITLFGGVEVEGELYTAENFMELLQYKVEVDWHQQGLEVEQRKDIVGAIGNVLKEKILDLSLDNLRPIIFSVLDSFENKDVILYDTDPLVLDVYRSNNWTGALEETNSDYLMVVDTNLASLKTDEVMERRLSYRLEVENDSLVATANMAYDHQGEESWKHTDLKSYSRFYVPSASELLLANGAGKIEKINEFGKLALGTYIKVPVGGNYNLQMKYRLPTEIYEQYKNGEYCLYIQKQPGTAHGLIITLPILNEDYRFMTKHEVIDPVLASGNYIIYADLKKDFYGCLVKE